jgi:hypothetical protein
MCALLPPGDGRPLQHEILHELFSVFRPSNCRPSEEGWGGNKAYVGIRPRHLSCSNRGTTYPTSKKPVEKLAIQGAITGRQLTGLWPGSRFSRWEIGRSVGVVMTHRGKMGCPRCAPIRQACLKYCLRTDWLCFVPSNAIRSEVRLEPR